MLVKFAAPVASASGKQDDSLVYMAWRGVPCARSYVKPSNPQSTNQTTVRTYFSQLTKAFAGLATGERASWSTYAANNLVNDRMGRQVRSTALGCYVQLGALNKIRGVAAVATAPTTAAPSGITAVSAVTVLSSANTSLLITHGYSTITNLFVLVRYMPVSSVAVTADPRRMSLICGATSASIVALKASGQTYAYTNIREAMIDGTRYIVSVQIVDQYGQSSVPVTANLLQTVS